MLMVQFQNTLRQNEMERRLKILGDLNLNGSDTPGYQQMKIRANEVGLPVQVLLGWQKKFSTGGESALVEDLPDLTQEELILALERQSELGDAANSILFSPDLIDDIAARNNWSQQRALGWWHRWQAGGLWGLVPRYNPFRRQRMSSYERDLGALNEHELETAFQRLEYIKPLIEISALTKADVEQRVEALRQAGVKISVRTLQDWLRKYRKNGINGLTPKPRSDRGSYKISSKMVEIVRGARLSHKDASVRKVFDEVTKIAEELGEPAPSLHQVRKICNQIRPEVKLYADGRYQEFRNKYRLTYPIAFGKRVVYQIDHTKVDVLAIDQRPKKIRTTSGEIRPWLTLIMESRSRRVLAWLLHYDQPDQHVVAAVICLAILAGGIPDAIWTDNGKDLTAKHIQAIADELGFELVVLDRHQPQQKGRVERLFGTLNTRLWSTKAGYVNSNTTDRNPTAKAKYTISEIDQFLTDFIEQTYHQEKHSSTGKTPLEYWNEFILTYPADPRHLDLLMMKSQLCTVTKHGIRYQNRIFWHHKLGLLVGQRVLIRSPHPYISPDEIEVFDLASYTSDSDFEGKKWVCTAFATDSKRGQTLAREDVAAGNRDQISNIQETRDQARNAYKQAKQQIGKDEGQPSKKDSPSSKQAKRTKPGKKTTSKRVSNRAKPDIFDRIEDDN